MCMCWTCQIPLDVALKKVLQDPDLLVFTDYGKIQKHQSLHLAFQALQEFKQKYNRLPKPRNQVSSESFVELLNGTQVDRLTTMLHHNFSGIVGYLSDHL